MVELLILMLIMQYRSRTMIVLILIIYPLPFLLTYHLLILMLLQVMHRYQPEAMGNLRNAKCESAKGNLRNHVRKMRAKNG